MRGLLRSLVGAAIGFVLAAALAAVIQWTYYQFMPASWFIHIQGIPQVANASVGDDLLLTFCRMARDPGYDTVSTRSFYKVADGGKYTAVGQYEFKARIEHDSLCQTIHIPPSKHPNRAGTYIAHTDITFSVHGHGKSLSYDTNQFVISDTKQSIEQQIQQLQRQIDALEQQLSMRGNAPSLVASFSPSPVSQTATSPAVQSKAAQAAPAQPTAPPVQPSQPPPAGNTQPVRRLLQSILNGIKL